MKIKYYDWYDFPTPSNNWGGYFFQSPVSDKFISNDFNDENGDVSLDVNLAGYSKSDVRVSYKKVDSQTSPPSDIYKFYIRYGKEDDEKLLTRNLVLKKGCDLEDVNLSMKNGLLNIKVKVSDNSPQEIQASF